MKMLVTFRLSTLGFGGTERVFLSVADSLSSTYGWSVDFVVDKITGNGTEQVAIANGYSVVSLGMPCTWKTIFPFSQYLKERRPDIVISAYTETNAAALISNAVNGFRTTVIVTEHAPLDEHWAGKPWMRRMMLEFMVRYVYKLAGHVMCVSRGMAEQLGKRLKHRSISYIHNPVRFSSRTQTKAQARDMLGIRHDIHMIIAVGRICQAKNYLMLLRAFKSIATENKTHLYIVGGIFEVSEELKLRRFIEENNIGEYVHFIGFTHELYVYYEAADLLVLSSAWEGFGNVLVEALAFGLPIVSSRCNYGPAEILADGEFGVLVDVNDHLSMGRAIQQVLAQNNFDPERQIQHAKSFSEQRIGAAYQKMICEAKGSIA